MNGFTDIVNGFSQSAIDALKTEADSIYISDEPSVPLVPTDAISMTFSTPGESLTIENALFEDINGIAIDITGQRDTGQTLIIKDCKFVNINWCINSYFIDNVVLTGCYFENVGAGIKASKPKDFECNYNKIKNYGVMLPDDASWSGNAIQVTYAGAVTRLEIEHNLCDRSTDNRPNTHENTFAEDHISLHSTSMSGDAIGSIQHNYVIGAESNCESIGGGGITVDQYGRNHNISNNVIYNTGGFCIGLASSTDCVFDSNLGMQTITHDNNLRNNQNNSDISGPGQNTGLTITDWLSDPGDPNPTDNITITNSRINGWRDPDDGTWYQWLDVPLDNLTMSNNSFTKTKSTGSTTDGLDYVTETEMNTLCFGAGGEGLFETHGQGPLYFDESRTT